MNLILRKYQRSPNLWGSWQNDWSMIFKSVEITQVKERLKNCSKLRDGRDRRATHNSELDFFPKEVIIQLTGKSAWALKIRWRWYISLLLSYFWHMSIVAMRKKMALFIENDTKKLRDDDDWISWWHFRMVMKKRFFLWYSLL